MEIVIDLKSLRKARKLRKMLLSVPFEDKVNIRLARSTKSAHRLCKRYTIDCVIYSREYTDELQAYFCKYTYFPKWFMPYSLVDDKNDAIDALNSEMTAYYIIEPLDNEKVAQALKCVKMRIE